MRVLKGEELTTLYPDLFKRVFGVDPKNQIPRTVMVDDKEEGFISGYLIDRENFYMSWAGHVKGFKGVRRCFLDMEVQMVEAGIKYFISRIHNRNTVTQRLLLGMGWFPRGAITSEGGLHIEYIKELTDGIIRSN